MITDAMLREAAGEAERFLLAHLPEPQPHHFSPRFERRMRKLISRAKHPVRHQVLRYVAAVLLAVFTLFGAILAVSPEVRAAVFATGWVRKNIDGHLHYFYKGGDAPPAADYELTALPEDCELLEVFQTEGGKTYLYLLDGKSLLEFNYVCASASGHYAQSIKKLARHKVTVNGLPADVYLSIYGDRMNMIVWVNPDEGTVFHIASNVDQEALIKMAESVRKTEKSE